MRRYLAMETANKFAQPVAWTSIFCMLIRSAQAIPNVAFPFNAQVPAVARVKQQYSFQFSDSTFQPSSDLEYSLSNQPAWLTVDSATRTLEGTPGQADAGSTSFVLTAADTTGAAHMPCILVVSQDQAPQPQGDISKQIAISANLSSSQPPVVTILPSTPFHFDFQQSSFIDIVRRKLFYYATIADHTPLPAWLGFDAGNLAFSGTAPSLSAFPQSWNIDLIASDVAGFAGATASFTIAIGTEQLAFVPQEQNVTIESGQELHFTALKDKLYRNGVQIDPRDLNSAQASVPDWITFDASSLELSGTPPSDATDQTASVTATYSQGGVATAVINFLAGQGDESLFAGTIGSITAYTGQSLDYHLPDSLFKQSGLDLSVSLPDSASWLHFDQSSRDLEGAVPTSTEASTIVATLTAKSSTAPSQTQVFTINIKKSTRSTTSTTSDIASSRAATQSTSSSTTASTASGYAASSGSNNNLSGGAIAAIVILSLVGAVALLLCLLWYCRSRKRRGYERQKQNSSKPAFSDPDPRPASGDGIMVTREVQRDVEKATGIDDVPPPNARFEPPPQISLDLPPQSTAKKWFSNRASRMSQASSLGDGEGAIRADLNIPELGHQSSALHTPHDSFALSTEMARGSRHLSQVSPSKRALDRLKRKHRSEQSIGLGIEMSGALPRHSSMQRPGFHRRRTSSVGRRGTFDSASLASMSTRGTSVLSAKPSDFPRPAPKSTASAMSIPALALTAAEKRKSIRLVTRSDSVSDDRPIAEKRQSYIRNRASGLQSPLFAHGSRASSNNAKQTGQRSASGSATGSVRRSRGSESLLKTYSESSSLEPRHEHGRFSARIRSTFAPNFPRAITQSSMGADDEDDSSSDFYTTESSFSGNDFAAELALPRNQRSWVLPGEASPTPPPGSSLSQFPSAQKSRVHSLKKDRSSSPLGSTALAMPVRDKKSLAQVGKASQARRSRLSEPFSLVSTDSLSGARPRLVQTSSKRPVSVEAVSRLSSLRAETATTAGSERSLYEEESSTRLSNATGGVRKFTQRSDMSGPAFL